MSHPSGPEPGDRPPSSAAHGTPGWPRAATIPVHWGRLLLTGWAIRDDAVLVRASGLDESATVTVNGRNLGVLKVHESTTGKGNWEPLSALQLPAGTLEVSGDAFPPGLEPPRPPGDPVRQPGWCHYFPWLPRC
ncbi:hypothetical protein [Glutamicibacter creatinolyticus]|uniref:hypothetical protein n=1 Tax=Glutamicibacter creatinolyticus TaxID=162496 RepID=UPI0032176779